MQKTKNVMKGLTAKEEEIDRIEKLYSQFAETISDKELTPDSIFKFIEKNKFNF